jgi:two-component system, cell cycle response regulator DivK
MSGAANAPRVLVVDDNPLNVELARAVLAADGFEVDAAADAAEAAQRIHLFRPALVLMDVQLPGVDGLTLTRQIKADPATRGIVVLAFTAYAMKGDEAKMLQAGCDGYLSKPIDVGSFAAAVRARLPPAAL